MVVMEVMALDQVEYLCKVDLGERVAPGQNQLEQREVVEVLVAQVELVEDPK